MTLLYCVLPAVPLPDDATREALIRHLLRSENYSLSSRDMQAVVRATQGYSGSDLKALCKDAALGPLRALGSRVAQVDSSAIRPINASDFTVALQRVRASVSGATVRQLESWNAQYGVSAAG